LTFFCDDHPDHFRERVLWQYDWPADGKILKTWSALTEIRECRQKTSILAPGTLDEMFGAGYKTFIRDWVLVIWTLFHKIFIITFWDFESIWFWSKRSQFQTIGQGWEWLMSLLLAVMSLDLHYCWHISSVTMWKIKYR
jgi:hypothetical protein